MQIRCSHCHKPYALSKEAVHQALDQMAANPELHHHDAPCPHCRRVNHVSKAELVHAAPEWGHKPQA
jgi:phage FluMu protein Com